tara:strand:+ start:183 stop:440 length:258 start_codon:yes stop_codon:yes gene_type:complete
MMANGKDNKEGKEIPELQKELQPEDVQVYSEEESFWREVRDKAERGIVEAHAYIKGNENAIKLHKEIIHLAERRIEVEEAIRAKK